MSELQSDLQVQLEGFRLTTAQIYYHLPDYPDLLQEFIWQRYDIAPAFPKLYGFIDFWQKEIEGSLHSVYVAKKELISPAQTRMLDAEFTLQ